MRQRGPPAAPSASAGRAASPGVGDRPQHSTTTVTAQGARANGASSSAAGATKGGAAGLAATSSTSALAALLPEGLQAAGVNMVKVRRTVDGCLLQGCIKC